VHRLNQVAVGGGGGGGGGGGPINTFDICSFFRFRMQRIRPQFIRLLRRWRWRWAHRNIRHLFSHYSDFITKLRLSRRRRRRRRWWSHQHIRHLISSFDFAENSKPISQTRGPLAAVAVAEGVPSTHLTSDFFFQLYGSITQIGLAVTASAVPSPEEAVAGEVVPS